MNYLVVWEKLLVKVHHFDGFAIYGGSPIPTRRRKPYVEEIPVGVETYRSVVSGRGVRKVKAVASFPRTN